uniref:EGF-like domain-containing protein n=1 Tax=Trichuris muris TaxID=70415 RepID=A0A5S6QZY4_TRIMR
MIGLCLLTTLVCQASGTGLLASPAEDKEDRQVAPKTVASTTLIAVVEAVEFDVAQFILDECPKVHCLGRDCVMVHERGGCRTCACPIGSRARGCDKMPKGMLKDLFTNGCRDLKSPYSKPHPATPVHRWYRHVDYEARIDECRSYLFPFCEDYEKNVWPAPTAKQECLRYCY